jgi:GrpB-like predicted nucleotidyltransferase (UPF0157 family)
MAGIELRRPVGSWGPAYDQAARWLKLLLGAAPEIEHIGSTAVPGLDAKPILDILIGAHAGDLGALALRLKAQGFAEGTAAGPARVSFFLSRPAADGHPPMNLHLAPIGSQQWCDLLQFRDRLRDDAILARRYEGLKHHLAVKSGGDLDLYTAGKSGFVAEVLGSKS